MDHTTYLLGRMPNALKVYRVAVGLTQAQLGEMAGISRESVNAFERKRTVPNLRNARALAHVLKVGVDDLFPGLKDDNNG